MPRSSSFSIGSLHSKSTIICYSCVLISPRFILIGLLIFSMSSILTAVDPMPPCTQNTLFYDFLSVIIAAKGIWSNISLILLNTEFGELMSSPRRLAHSSPKPRYLFTFLSSWLPLSRNIYLGYFSFRAMSRHIVSKL